MKDRKLIFGSALLASLIIGAFAFSASAANIDWQAPKATVNADDINTSGTTIYALNGGVESLLINGITFSASNYANLPSGIEIAGTGTSAGNSPTTGIVTSVYNGSMTSTGNSNYDKLISTLTYSNGTPGGIQTGYMKFNGLQVGRTYSLQVWYNDQRTGLDTRVMKYGDGNSNSVNLVSGNSAAGVQKNSYGQYAVGQFTATGTSQKVSMESIGFGNVHYNAILLKSTDSAPAKPALPAKATSGWTIETQEQWVAAASNSQQFTIENGRAAPTTQNAVFESRVQLFEKKQKFTKFTMKQTENWGMAKWTDAGKVAPDNKRDAAVFISPKEGEYYYLNSPYGGTNYHVYHSTDMENWTSYGDVIGKNWVTSAEYADGKFYIYYDNPNDEDPHLITFTDLKTGAGRTDHGKVLDSPSSGSDMAAFRDKTGTFHIIYEDWSAIDAQAHSWDSQYAGHTSSPDGINGFTAHEHTAVIDNRGNPTGAIGTYTHPHTGAKTYQVHDGSLDAYGDYEMIQIGDTYYLFCDYHPEGEAIGLGYWMSKDLYGKFEWGGVIRTGLHPDPAVGFANGKFYMFVQDLDDMTSSGPWVDGIKCQVGVDTDGDGEADVWTEWQEIVETYARLEGFAKIFELDPAEIDLSDLPEGYGIQFRFSSEELGAVMDGIYIESHDVPEPTILSLLAIGATVMLKRKKKLS